MNLNLSNLINQGEVVAVALSGGSDSMALLYFMCSVSEKFGFSVVALNVEHGIRGNDSIADSNFVADYCLKNSIPLISYKVDSLKKAEEEKISIEQSARILRYECFFDAINGGKCNKVATAHHQSDNVESVLFNLFRGTGIKGITGIKSNYENKIIRPFLSVKKEEIQKYVEQHQIPFVTDKTNFSDEYTRNNLRLNVIPSIKKVFPKMDQSIARFAEIATVEDEYMDGQAEKILITKPDRVEIGLPIHRAIFMRAVVKALKVLGIEKDWEFIHLTDAYSLAEKETGRKIDLPKGVTAIREYDKIVFYKPNATDNFEEKFRTGEFLFGGQKIKIEKVKNTNFDLKNGLFCDGDKIPENAVIRLRKDGDVFTKFGGGTKSLGDYLTDKKIPLRERDNIPLLAVKNQVLCIFGTAVSDAIKVDENTKTILEFIID